MYKGDENPTNPSHGVYYSIPLSAISVISYMKLGSVVRSQQLYQMLCLSPDGFVFSCILSSLYLIYGFTGRHFSVNEFAVNLL